MHTAVKYGVPAARHDQTLFDNRGNKRISNQNLGASIKTISIFVTPIPKVLDAIVLSVGTLRLYYQQ